MSSCLQDPVAKRLEGKVAIITGGAGGIGAATAKLFVRHGAKVVVADIQDDLGHALADEIGSPEALSFIHCDVSKESDVQNMVDSVVDRHGKLDVMFSNAGALGKPVFSILDVSREAIERVFDVNVFGAFYCAKHAARVMIPRGMGYIMFDASVTSECFGDMPHAYASSKCAMVGIAKNLCVELGKYGIRVNCISPSAVATPMALNTLGMNREAVNSLILEQATLKGAVNEEEDVANAALFLASDGASYISGMNLMIDGGYSITNKAFSVAIQKLAS